MPNSRRRKFSVQFDLESRPSRFQSQNVTLDSNINVDTKLITSKVDQKCKYENQPSQNTSKHQQNQIDKKNSNTIISSTKRTTTADKKVTVSISSNNLNNNTENLVPPLSSCDKTFITSNEDARKNQAESSKPRTGMGRERHARQHKIKIRNPRRRIVLSDYYNKVVMGRSIGINTENSKSTFNTINVESVTDAYVNIERASNNSLEDMCRICHGDDTSQELGSLISACSCRGTVGRVHVKCLERWLTESGKSRCELCGIRYITRRVHRYGVPRALVMWILSQNAKQLMVDTLGIILMSPLAILAAWLSGRTFSTLISQENHVVPAPWPLASTFVLACMTLVCYYCWIVSAATRHTLSWWIWYRSQYEVRLQLHSDSED
ncbi:uncharacterized protein [Battus philenor]|uniref:uncharacterized protein n=1 Tax=Battus philenor TaxID=42288 RepID=UPI0035D0777D